MKQKPTATLIVIKSTMDSKDYVNLNQLLKKNQGHKYAPNIFKFTADKAPTIVDYLQQEQLIYELYQQKEGSN